jgi:hypothetical protein
MKANITINGQIQESTMKVQDIKKLENPCNFDQYLKFQKNTYN